MRTLKFRLLIFSLAAFSLGMFFYFKTPPTKVETKSSIEGHPVEVKNEAYIKKKLDDLDIWDNARVSRVIFVVSDQPQKNAIAKRGGDKPGDGETSLAYSAKRDKDLVTVTLYVNPKMYPTSDKAELNRQYSQLALIAIYTMFPMKEPKTPENMKKFIADYRADMESKQIFDIK